MTSGAEPTMPPVTQPTDASSVGALPSDPWPARLAFHLLRKAGPWWVTLWLVLIIGGLVALGMVAGPWVPGIITAVGALTAGGTAAVRHLAKPPANEPEPPGDPPSEKPDPEADR